MSYVVAKQTTFVTGRRKVQGGRPYHAASSVVRENPTLFQQLDDWASENAVTEAPAAKKSTKKAAKK